MATYNTLTKGSTGADVKKLQQNLIDKGYDLGKTGADGKYGAKTQAAVTQYQKDNKLTVDGMAGKQTQGALYTVPKTTTAAGNKQTMELNAGAPTGNKQTMELNAGAPAGTKELYSDNNNGSGVGVGAGVGAGAGVGQGNKTTNETDPLAPPAATAYDPATDTAYQSALATLLQVQQTAPTYKDSYSSQLQDVYNKIVNREKFSFDVNSDAMYQQYKDQYIAQGKLAMADTMGQAAAMNGGYGSSYGQSVGQQAYQGYMQQLNDRVPELYGMALDRYNQEGQDMLNQYAMLGDMADDEYAKYQDSLNKYYRDVDMARSEVDKAYDRGYGAYRDSVGDGQWQQSFDHGVEQDKIGNEQWEKSYAESVKQNEISNKQWQAQFDENVKQNDISNKQWEDSFEYGKKQDTIANDRLDRQEEREKKAENYNKVMSFVGTDYTPSDKELYVAGITRDQYNAMGKYYSGTGGTTAAGGTSAGNTTTRDNVKTMSSSEILEAIEGFVGLGAGDATYEDKVMADKNLHAFLADCVSTNRMSALQAEEYYGMYTYGAWVPPNEKAGTTTGTIAGFRGTVNPTGVVTQASPNLKGSSSDHFASVLAGGVARGPYHNIFSKK